MPAAEKRADGVSLYAGMDEHSLMLYLRPDLVAPDYRTAPVVSGANSAADSAVAQQPGWSGYLGAPHLATAAYGQRIWKAFAEAARATSVELLDGKDPGTYPRYLTYLRKLPQYQEWIDSTNARDAVAGDRLARWMAGRPR